MSGNADIRLRLLLGAPSPCNYLPDNASQSLFVDPDMEMTAHIYSQLAEQGFRRSGSHIYRPHCPGCNACIPVRVEVDNFKPNRQQRRTLKKNQDLEVDITQLPDYNQHLELFQHYVKQRHKDGGMDDMEGYSPFDFLQSDWSDTLFLEVRLEGQLIACAVTDVLHNGLSAVYTYFDPEQRSRSLGVYCLLKQLEAAKEQGLPYLYLGYWIEACQKMSYKTNYQPIQTFYDNKWGKIKK